MRVLVTGGAGFIGSHVVATLRERGHEAIVFDVREDPAADVRDPTAVGRALAGVEAVCHKAASLIYRKSASGSYRDEASYHEGQARQFWWNAVVEVKSDPEREEPDLRIGRDVTFLT